MRMIGVDVGGTFTDVVYAEREGLKLGQLTGIGALKDVELGFYHLKDKTYDRKMFKGEAELLSLDGNLTLFENKPFFHIFFSLKVSLRVKICNKLYMA